mmetsp:Transcript_63497/g.169603  ORF Transcript_63497/g.169603 Transcript_63497/m.169603 type:complete len:220 (-) Transcript_63497:104-763(-)
MRPKAHASARIASTPWVLVTFRYLVPFATVANSLPFGFQVMDMVAPEGSSTRSGTMAHLGSLPVASSNMYTSPFPLLAIFPNNFPSPLLISSPAEMETRRLSGSPWMPWPRTCRHRGLPRAAGNKQALKSLAPVVPPKMSADQPTQGVRCRYSIGINRGTSLFCERTLLQIAGMASLRTPNLGMAQRPFVTCDHRSMSVSALSSSGSSLVATLTVNRTR